MRYLLLAANQADGKAYKAAHPELANVPVQTCHDLDNCRGYSVDRLIATPLALEHPQFPELREQALICLWGRDVDV